MSRTFREPSPEAIQAELRRGGLRLSFAPEIELAFERDTGAARARHLIRAGILALLFPNAFLIPDSLIIPDVFGYTLALHAVCSVTYSAILFLTARGLPAVWREASHGAALTMSLAGTVLLFWASHAPERGYLTVTFLLFIVYVNVAMRLRQTWCLVFNTTGASVALTAMLLFSRGLSGGVQSLMLLSVCTCAAFTLYANYTLEAAERRSYLLTLQQRLAAEELVAVNAQLRLLSKTDWLTGAANRRGMEDWLAQAWQAAASADRTLSLLMIDVDHFKKFNDCQGHPAGDACLLRLAQLIGMELRAGTDHLARYGGEEFAVILPDTLLADAVQTAERIRQSIEECGLPHGAEGAGPTVTVSVGAASMRPLEGDGRQELIAAADHALYESKQRGRNRVHPPPLLVIGRRASSAPLLKEMAGLSDKRIAV